eukprot:3449325-Amphidinium_carterae.1
MDRLWGGGAFLLRSFPQERLVSAGDDHLVALWNVVTGEKLRNFPHAAILHGVHLHGSDPPKKARASHSEYLDISQSVQDGCKFSEGFV